MADQSMGGWRNALRHRWAMAGRGAQVRTVRARNDTPTDTSILAREVVTAIPMAAVCTNDRRILVAGNELARADFSFALQAPMPMIEREPALTKSIAEVLRTGTIEVHDVVEVVPTRRSWNVSITRLELPGHDQPVVLLVFRDLGEQERLARMRADFVANASHELRTPLASLKGFIETLQTSAKNDPKAREEFLDIMHAQAMRMTRQIDDLLSLSRVEMQQHVTPTTVIDLTAISERAVAALKPVAEASRRHLSFYAEGPASMRGDADEILQAMSNLIQNAIKYGAPSGIVGIAVRRAENHVSVSVTDDGIGIAPEHIPRLTERFYRVNAKTSRERGGTGLGLAIVKHVVTRHRGELTIDSLLGRGSTFAMTFPVADISKPNQ